MKKYKIKKTKKLIKELKPFWKNLKYLQGKFYKEIYELEKKMEKETGIKETIFFMCDNYICGIGNADRTMELIHDRELENGE